MSPRRIAGDVAVLAHRAAARGAVPARVAADLSLVAGAPDLVLIVVCGVALARGPEAGCLAGFGAGLALDVLAQHALGRDALSTASRATASERPARSCARPRPCGASS